MKSSPKKFEKKGRIEEILSDEKRLTAILRKAAREAVKAHRLTGDPIAVMKNGKTVWIEPK
jgi:hypothetical protein